MRVMTTANAAAIANFFYIVCLNCALATNGSTKTGKCPFSSCLRTNAKTKTLAIDYTENCIQEGYLALPSRSVWARRALEFPPSRLPLSPSPPPRSQHRMSTPHMHRCKPAPRADMARAFGRRHEKRKTSCRHRCTKPKQAEAAGTRVPPSDTVIRASGILAVYFACGLFRSARSRYTHSFFTSLSI